MKPLGQKIIIRKIEENEERLENAFLNLPQKKSKDGLGEVLAVGDMVKESEVKIGDKLKYISGHAISATHDGEEVLSINKSDIIFIL